VVELLIALLQKGGSLLMALKAIAFVCHSSKLGGMVKEVYWRFNNCGGFYVCVERNRLSGGSFKSGGSY